MIRVVTLAVVLFGLAAFLAATRGEAVPAQGTKLLGTVGPGFSITLRDAQGNPVTRVDPGTYDIEVRDLSDLHSFHLRGPGVDERTQVEFTGTVNWTVTFQNGEYVFFCDVHPQDMRGTLVSGNPPAQPPPAPPAPAVTAKTKLVVTSGPQDVITLKTSAGKAVKQMKLGTYKVTVRDRGRDHNVHIVAPGYNRKTQPIAYRGTQTWSVKLARTGTFRFLCDPHAALGMRGSAKIVR